MSQTNINNRNSDDYSKILGEIIDKVFLFEVDNKIYYSKNHLCLQETDENVFIVGFDSHITNLLSFINTIILTSIKEQVYEGKAFGWMVLSGKTFSVYSPVNATILEHNKKIVDTPDNLRNRKFPENWFTKFKFDNKEAELKKLMYGKLAEIWYKEANQKLRSEIINILQVSHPKELVTQYDGGKFIYTINEILPANEWIRILNSMLRIK